ncbi:MAG: MotA/TolQ/ExbB proton channel family protein [Planctomycetaceae bacterium]
MIRRTSPAARRYTLWGVAACMLVLTLVWNQPLVAQPPDGAAASPGEKPVSPGNELAAAAPDAKGLPTNLVDISRELGYWLVPFVLATLIALWFSTERLVVLRRGRVIPKPFVERFLKHLADRTLGRDEALEICEDNGSPVAMVFAHGVRKWGKPSVEVEQAIIDGGERQVASLRTHLRVINGVATVTPLLGLLGTVWGMLEAFNDIAAAGAMGNTTVLAHGIAVALLTTACGLVIAIPSLIIYMYLSGRVDSLVMDMDEHAQSVVHAISAESLASQTRPKSKAAS